MPMGVLSFMSGAQTFSAVQIVIPPQPLAASKLAGVRVLVGGFPAPLIYATDKQSAAIVPFEMTGQATTEIRVE
jgi:uncharacterized protein (TIGR03437 family)